MGSWCSSIIKNWIFWISATQVLVPLWEAGWHPGSHSWPQILLQPPDGRIPKIAPAYKLQFSNRIPVGLNPQLVLLKCIWKGLQPPFHQFSSSVHCNWVWWHIFATNHSWSQTKCKGDAPVTPHIGSLAWKQAWCIYFLKNFAIKPFDSQRIWRPKGGQQNSNGETPPGHNNDKGNP